MFHSEFPQAKVIITCTRTSIYNYCDQDDLLGDILYDGGNVDQQEYFLFSSLFFKKSLSIIDDITKMELTRINRTQLLNIDKNKLENMICDDID